MDQRKSVFVVLGGGGAKGVAHIGALRALETLEYEIIGIAGTSAGALVAALRAYGLKSYDIIDEENRQHVLHTLHPKFDNATQILGKDWRKLAAFRWVIKQAYRFTRRRKSFQFRVFSILSTAILLVLLTQAPAALSLVLLLAFCLLGYMFSRWILAGLASLDEFVRCLTLLGIRCTGSRPYFRDFAQAAGDRPTLKMVASNITSGTMELFSPDRTPDVPVAEAVAASICLPIMFRSRRICEGLPGGEKHQFLDGGLVSNVPAWAFDDDRVVHEWPLTIVIEIADSPGEVRDSQSSSEWLQWLMQTARTTVFGSKALNVRGIEPDVLVRLPILDSDLGLTDFDADWDTILSVIHQAKRATLVALGVETERRGTILRLSTEIQEILSQPEEPEGENYRIGNLRVTMGALRPWKCAEYNRGAHTTLISAVSIGPMLKVIVLPLCQ